VKLPLVGGSYLQQGFGTRTALYLRAFAFSPETYPL
jgi:hypothetical protein